ncbi:unnamed protein product [Urochloa decumbens]|uniref:Uncharacterized protein n=1 Tax=Urochloa decumbens TaxID=240449 RepID=A0ABC9DID1_9POAL
MADRPILPRMVPGDFLHQQRAIVAGRRAQLPANAGALLVSAAGSVIIDAATDGDAASDAGGGAAYPFIALFIFVLGVSLVMLAHVADRFPRAATVGAAVAMALGRYLFGLGW